MLRLFLLSLFLLTFLLPIFAWIDNTGGLTRLFDIHEPPGQSWYLLSRLFGVVALSAACWQFFIGLERRLPVVLFSRPELRSLVHAQFGLLTFLLFWSHALCFVTAVSIRKSQFAYGFLLPNVDDYYHSVISIGWLALVAISVAVFARLFSISKQQYWHKLVYAVLPLAVAHSVLVGTETRDIVMLVNYGLLAIIWCISVSLVFFVKTPPMKSHDVT